MNAADVLKYGQRTVLTTIDGLPEAEWETPGVCGYWSVKQIIAHLASYEQVLVHILSSCLGADRTPTLDRYLSPDTDFNDDQVAKRQHLSPADTLAEFNDAHARAASLISQIPIETLRRPGVLAWYGAEYDLEDVIAYMYYGHKREHSAQIAVFRDRLNR